MEAIRPGSTSEPQVPKPLELYEVIPDDLFDEELYEEANTSEGTELYIDVPDLPPPLPPLPAARHIGGTPPPEPLQPPRKELYVNLESDLYAYFDPDEQPAAEDPTTPTKQISISESGYLSLLNRDQTDEDSYMGLIYEPPLPPPPLQPPPPPVQSPPPVAKDHSSLTQRALQYLDPAQLDIMIQMLQKLKGEPGPTAVPRPLSPLPMKKDDDLYEDIYSLDVSSEASSIQNDNDLYEDINSSDMSSALEVATAPQIPPPLPPDRPVPGKQIFTPKAASFRKQSSRQKESNLGEFLCALPLGHCSMQLFVSLSELLLKRATINSDKM